MKSFFYMQRNDRRAIMAVMVVIAVVAGIMIYIGDGGGLPPDAPADSITINAAGEMRGAAERKTAATMPLKGARRSCSRSTRTLQTAPSCCV